MTLNVILKAINKPWLPQKTLMVMKLTTFILLITFLQCSANVFSQKININETNVPLKKVLSLINQQSGYVFFYESKDIKNKTITVAIKDGSISETLNKCLKDEQLNYVIIQNTIFINRQENKPNTPAVLPVQAVVLSITGQVLDEKNLPLPGVTVKLKGSAVGAVTDNQGQFKIDVPNASAVLVFSFVGYATQEDAVVVGQPMTIHMKLDDSKLSEIVVIGYGSIKKSDLTGAVASVQAKDLVTAGSSSVDKALQGKLAGVDVESAGGAPGSGMSILVRGVGTINNTTPLYVVDGMYVSSISNIAPGDIASISVLKDASAAAIYGTRAANGVVLVTTKSGSGGQTSISFDSYYGVQTIQKKLSVLDATQWGQVDNAMHDNAGIARLPLANKPDSLGPSTNWQNAIYRTAPIQNYELNISGSGKGTTYSISGGYLDQKGIVDQTGYNRYNLRFKSETKLGIIKFGESVILSQENWQNLPGSWGGQGGNPVGAAAKSIPAFQIYDPTAVGGYAGPTGSVINIENPVAQLYLEQSTTRTNSALINTFGQVDIVKGFYYKINFGFTDYLTHDFDYKPRYQVGSFFSNATNNINTDDNKDDNTVLVENTLNFDRQFGKNHIQALVGYTYQNEKYQYNNETAAGLPDGIYQADAATGATQAFGNASQAALVSQLARVVYSYDDRYLFTGSVRRDGSSRFGDANRYGVFPSVAAGWNISNEKFFTNSKLASVISLLKLRGSFGVLGNQEFANYQYGAAIASNVNYVTGTGQTLWSGATQQAYADPDIKWETSKTSDVGAELGFFNNALNLTADYYHKVTSDMLVQVPIPGSAGSTSSPYVNAGSISNNGLELSLSYHGVAHDFTYNVFGTFSTNQNKVLSLGSGSEQIIGGYPDLHGEGTTTTQVGGPVGAFYLVKTAGIFQSQAQIDAYKDKNGQLIQPNAAPGDIKFVDYNGDGQISDADKQYVGSPNPKFTYGFGYNARYKNFDMSVYFQGTYGNMIYNGFRMDLEGMNVDYNMSTTTLNAWTPTNTNTNMPRAVYGDPNGNDRVSDRFLESGSYLRCKSLQFGYNFKMQAIQSIGIKSLRAYISFDNLFTITNYTGLNPDLGVIAGQNIFSRGVDYSYTAYPLARVSTIGVQLSL